MSKKILMLIDGERYEYGTYPCETPEQENRLNEIAMKVRDDRGCEVEVVEV